jgi:CRISPR-associated endoribonuclease Cas6
MRSWQSLERVHEAQTCRMRLCLADEELARSLALRFLDAGPRLHILGQEWALAHLWLTRDSPEPWAGHEPLQALSGRLQPERELELELATPTTFRQGDIDLPLPLPALVFGSLFKRASQFFPTLFQPGDAQRLAEILGSQVAVSRHRIQTARAIELGFVGTVRFEILRSVPEEMVLLLNFLAELAFYLGIGRKTTMGMGMARRLPARSPSVSRS